MSAPERSEAVELLAEVGEATDFERSQSFRESLERIDPSSGNIPWKVARAFLLIRCTISDDSEMVRRTVALVRRGDFVRDGER